jgi:AraC-like DNA-binding protein
MEQLFDVEVIPDHTGAATGWLEVQMPELTSRAAPDWKHLAVILRRSARPGIGLALTQSMFGCPCYAWTVGRVADELGVSRRELQMALFREAYSFAATLRRCRRLNKLLGDSLFQFVGHETHDPRDFAGPAIGKTV